MSENETEPKPFSKQFARKAARVVDAIQTRREGAQTKAFSPRDFVLFGLPYKRVQGSTYERRNGSMRFRVVGDPQFGVPFGQDRLLPLWLATAFKTMGCPEDNCVRFRSAADIIRAFWLPSEYREIGGKDLRELRARLERVFTATYFAWDERKKQNALTGQRYQLIASLRLWFVAKEHPNQYTLWQNVLQLDPRFADDIRRGLVPIDLNTVRALKGNSAALDLYLWEAYRSWRCMKQGTGEVHVPVFGPEGLLAQLGADVEHPKKARELMRKRQDLVRTVWPECPNELIRTAGGEDVLVVRPAEAVGKAQAILPGVSPRPPVPLLTMPEVSGRDAWHVEKPVK